MSLVKKILEDFDEQTKFDQSNTSYFPFRHNRVKVSEFLAITTTSS